MLDIMFHQGLLLLCVSVAVIGQDLTEKSAAYWEQVSEAELLETLQYQKLNIKKAKNVIIFIGDGMGVTTVTAGRILKGQNSGASGEETKLAMDKLPYTGVSRTYSVNRQVSDSASTATAFLTGVKTNDYVLGLNGNSVKGICAGSINESNLLTSVLLEAKMAGMSAGIVTTTTINHATPAAAYANSPDRLWYSDAEMTAEAKENGCKDIAQQFIDKSDQFTVVLGGGRQYFKPNTTFDVEYTDRANLRLDGQDLIEVWKAKQSDRNSAYVWNKEQFDQVDVAKTDSLLGLFEPSHMNYEAHRAQDGAGEPSLKDMTTKAIRMLKKNDQGFILLVEGGKIDHGHHAGKAYLALHDLVALDDAIEAAVEMTSDDETMIIVTADHSHVFTIGGYSHRGNPIFGAAPNVNNPKLVDDGKPFTTLLYGNGPGHSTLNGAGSCERENITLITTDDPGYKQQSAVPLPSETHGGEDVVIMARGPMAHLFEGVHEQSYIAHVIRYATCIGKKSKNCAAQLEQSTDLIFVSFLGFRLSSGQAQLALYITFGLLMAACIIAIAANLQLCRMARQSARKHEDPKVLNEKV
uniref:Alkaline phosphatase n=1 Tax=Ciona intestinalis TaxID=7719 RepID=A0A1W5BLB5_CIOIN|nr:endoderm-specific alkaline phosphatase isoform X1 [Ciona intestinalis]XP_026694117.1 endoderm-specific alkaline phosphatase isoform X1 [Ciona intestinalis]XP_026694118.1 endoderm-specific alkaline phosphatase isoform X1 [Ciona intestinalis]|eukprot:XP_018670967.1 endoderm-specific alkaline phosphatase isoform X1 [Ciona intestinalis]